jgi:ABC-type branched-subunit amino acid transport system ATPase component/ABC-type branched-subunit amino acid transport system permease subunit
VKTVRPTTAALLAAALIWPFLAENSTIFTVTAGMVLGLAALGLLAVVGWGRDVSLVQAGLTGAAAYVSGYTYRAADGWGLPFVVAALVGIAVVVTLSVLVAVGTTRLSGIYIMVLTLALQIVIEKTFFTSGKLTGGLTAVSTPRPWLFGIDVNSDRAFYYLVLGVVAVSVLALSRLRRSRFGRSLLLVGADRKAAAAVGVSPWRYKVFAFALAGVFAGVAGALTAPLYHSPPGVMQYSTLNSLLYLAVPVIAGFGSLAGVVLVGIVFTYVPQTLESYHLSPFILAGVGLAAGTLVGSKGLSGALSDLAARMRRNRQGGRELVLGDTEADGAQRQWALHVLEDYIPARQEGGDALVGRNLSIAFGGVQALRDVDVSVPLHAFVGLLGPNGAGKSTLFDVLNGLKRPDNGTVELFGRDVTGAPAWDRAQLGMSRTFQSNRINPDLSVAENLVAGAHKMIKGGFVGSLLGVGLAVRDEARAWEAARAVAVLLDLERWWDEPAGDLDFGAQRRIEIGRSLMSGPRLLLLDEPAAGLDSDEARRLFALVRRLQADLGLTVLLVEHYVKAVLENADLVYVLNQGQLLASGSPAEIASHPEVRAEYLGSAEFLLETASTTQERIDA